MSFGWAYDGYRRERTYFCRNCDQIFLRIPVLVLGQTDRWKEHLAQAKIDHMNECTERPTASALVYKETDTKLPRGEREWIGELTVLEPAGGDEE